MPTYLISLVLEAGRALDDISEHLVSSSAARTVTLLSLKNATANASVHRYDGTHVFYRDPGGEGQSRAVRPGGYDPVTGTLTVYPDWTTPPGISGIYLTNLFPIISQGSDQDATYRGLLNMALRRQAGRDRVELAIGTHWQYPLGGFSWLDRPERLLGVFESGPTGRGAVDAGWRGIRLVLDGPTPFLEVRAPFSEATGSLTLEVNRPGDSLIETAGVWAEGGGLVNDTDRCLPSTSDVMPSFLAAAYDALTARSPGRPYPKAAELAEMWRAEARKGRTYDASQDRPMAPSPQSEQPSAGAAA